MPPAKRAKPAKVVEEPAPSSVVDRVYDRIKSMAITYQLRPGDRLNEVEFGRMLDVSRTPLREALNRLVTEGFLSALPNRGFFARPLDAKEVFDLYEVRGGLEAYTVRLVSERATKAELLALEEFVIESKDEPEDQRATKLVKLDEAFHERIAELSRNQEMVRAIKSINSKIHFVRWIDMQGRRGMFQEEHLKIARALKRRDADQAAKLMEAHISRRLDQIVEVIKAGFAEIYMRP
jgi:DNA-binding GntR family transcriptional regulator